MSFLGDLVSSIGGDKAPAPPIKQTPRLITPTAKPVLAPSAAHSKPAVRSAYTGTAGTQPSVALKRKAEGENENYTAKAARPNSNPVPSSSIGSRSVPPAAGYGKSTVTKSVETGSIALLPSAPSNSSAKAPARGSYADILARAKEAQIAKAQSQVGMIKHQATEKIKISKIAERRKEEQEKLKNDKARPASRPGSSNKTDKDPRRSASPIKKSDQPRVLKAPRPPLHAPVSKYKGTMGKATDRSRNEKTSKKGRNDEYLDTDEDEDSEIEDYGDGDDYDSEGSAMEGGFDELEEEDERALRAARLDDAKELALEQKLKKEKLERKQKLAAMAAKRR